MTKQEAVYFLEGLACGIAAPSDHLTKALFMMLSLKYQIGKAELETARDEIDPLLNQVEEEEGPLV